MYRVWLIPIFTMLLFGAKVVESRWSEGLTLSRYLQEHNITCTIPKELRKNLNRIKAGEKIYELKDGNLLLQALVPIDGEVQIGIMRDINGTYRVETLPVVYRQVRDVVSLDINHGLKREIENKIGNSSLSSQIGRLFGRCSIFAKLQPSDKVVFEYTQKERMGKPFSSPKVLSALVETDNKDYFAYLDKSGNRHVGTHKSKAYTVIEERPYTYTTTKKIPAPKFRMPVARPRITSPFSLRRWHPIQHKYKPHHGIDFGGKTGTRLYATEEGTVIYAGWMNGYGKTTKIRHAGGLVSLYGHQSKILVRLGQKVKRGQVIGKMGSTGRSTGPHLHYGLYLHNRPINPMRYIYKKSSRKPKIVKETHKVMKKYKVTKYKQVPVSYAVKLKKNLKQHLKKENVENYIWNRDDRNIVYINDIITDIKNTKERDDG